MSSQPPADRYVLVAWVPVDERMDEEVAEALRRALREAGAVRVEVYERPAGYHVPTGEEAP